MEVAYGIYFYCEMTVSIMYSHVRIEMDSMYNFLRTKDIIVRAPVCTIMFFRIWQYVLSAAISIFKLLLPRTRARILNKKPVASVLKDWKSVSIYLLNSQNQINLVDIMYTYVNCSRQ